MNSYRLGTDVKTTGVFKDVTGAVFDPAGVTCKVQQPDGTETAYVYGADAQVVKLSTGTYYIWVTPTQVGKHVVRFKGSGTVLVADEASFLVNASAFVSP